MRPKQKQKQKRRGVWEKAAENEMERASRPAGRTYLECHLGFVGGDNRDVHDAGHNCREERTRNKAEFFSF